MHVKIRQWGNSAAIRLPASALKQLGLASGDVLNLEIVDQAMILKLSNSGPRYRLADLIMQCDLASPEPAELDAWNAIQPVGREV